MRLDLTAVNVHGLASLDRSKLVRRMGVLSPQQLEQVKTALRALLNL
jgi:mRNA-degrading endonuclease toxin of MazEF toxin-antitoxin module